MVVLLAATRMYCLLRVRSMTTGGLLYLPTPPLGQDMKQGQFLSGVLQIPSPRLVA